MIHKKILIMTAAISLFTFIAVDVSAMANDKFTYPFYVGVTGGYGSTTWNGLVPNIDKQNGALTISTPKYVNEGGEVWGLMAGYEFLPYFALEAAYWQYPDATVSFDPTSLFSFEHDGLTKFTTRTESISLMGKVMFIIPHTYNTRMYASFGVAEVYRQDKINNDWIVSPTFGAGFNYNFTEHIMGELGATYTAGLGEPELSPAEDYFPFLYSVFLRFAYRF